MSATATFRLYEGLFLMSQASVGVDPHNGVAIVKQVLDRAEAQTVCLYRWDERKLAYTISNQKRGTYYRAIFSADPQSLSQLERDCNLSEDILRTIVTKADHMGETEIAAAQEDAANADIRLNLEAQKAAEAAAMAGATSDDSDADDTDDEA